MDLKQLKLGIVGGGVVGMATARAYVEHVAEVRVYDILPKRATHNLVDTITCDLVFACLPTPQKEGSLECDISKVERFFSTVCHPSIDSFGRTANYVLRSTVPIGTTCRLREQYGLTNLVHSPEFLTARCAATDAHLPARNIIGNPIGGVGKGIPMSACEQRLWELYQQRFPGVPVHLMSSDESEAVKLFTNAAFSVKIALFNELRTLSDKLGLDWDRVLSGMLADGRISHSHTQVPGPDGKFGFGGTCLPKDLANLVNCFHQAGLDPAVCEDALLRNKLDRKEDGK